MKKTTRIFSLLLSIVMLLGVFPLSVLAGETTGLDNFVKVNFYDDSVYSDVSSDDWFYDNVKSAYEYGLMIGKNNNLFDTEGNVTIAETMTIAARLHSIYYNSKADFEQSEPWYQVYADYCKENGIADPADYEMNSKATRLQFAIILANALPEEALENINKVADNAIPDVKMADSFSAAVYKLYRAGVLVGNDNNGTFAPDSNIRRSEVAAIVTRMAAPSLRQSITLGNVYTVSFDLNYGGKVLESVTVFEGEKATKPSNPYRFGYSFSGWYSQATGGAKFDFNTSITKDITLYAHWSKNNPAPYIPPYNPPTPPTPTDTYYTVTFDSNGGSSVESQQVKAGECAVEPDVPVNGTYQFVGWFVDKNEKDLDTYFDFSTPIASSFTLYAKWIDITDTDGDNLVDGLETLYSTDKLKMDTDEDGLNDYIEIFVFGYNPVLNDSDANGTNDGNEDFDNDGLSNLAEVNGGTNPIMADTDDDGLNDGYEMELRTNPQKIDTDGDGVSDSKEIELGTDPLTAQPVFNMKISADNDGQGTVASVQIDLSGEQVETLNIQPVENDMFFPETMPGYMGQAYDFSVAGTFDNAEISFTFDNALLEVPGIDPVICYFNEENQELEELPTTVVGNVASTTVTHFSTYILINRTIYQSTFEWEDVWDASDYVGVQAVFVIDDSGSMDWNDSSNLRLTVAGNLIDNLPTDSKIGIVQFASSTTIRTDTLTSNRDTAKSYLTTTYFKSSGGTYMYGAIQSAFSLFEESDDNILKVMIVLSDGETSDTRLHSSAITTASTKGIKIYTVGLGSSTKYFTNYLKPLAENTGAAFYLASNASELSNIYKDIGKKIDIETDSDSDGIPDYYEDNMIIFSGIKLTLDKNNPDTDGDGLKDGEEVQLKYEYNANKTKVKVTGKLVFGNPTKKDTDGDGYDDGVDLNWEVPYKMPIILLHGLNDNTTCYGVSSIITKNMNTDYGSEYSKPDSNGVVYKYTDCVSQKILKISQNGRLGAYLTNQMSYEMNKNLFAFNYPNHDMVQYNGERLSEYITDLIQVAQNDSNLDVVDPNYLFATKEDKQNGNVQFILIGHSMGGLVSRYYIENIGTGFIAKLITIDTPHYGSGLADSSDITGDIIKYSPAIFDLNTDSTLYGGNTRKWDFSLGGIFRTDSKYALENQSPALKGNKGISTEYYAIGGYDVGRGWIGGEINQIAESLQDSVFAVEFSRDTSSKDNYKSSINTAVNNYSVTYCGTRSELDLGDADGDNTVDHMSQFAIRFKNNQIDSQNLKKTVIVIHAKSGCSISSPFHNLIHQESIMHEYVGAYIND